MGSRYAHRFLAAGFAVTVWNRSMHKAEPLVAAGARPAVSPAAALEEADVIVAALENAPALRETLLSPATLEKVTHRHLVIDTGTVHPGVAREAQALLARHGGRYLDAPVSGGTIGAAQGTLTLLVGGNPDDFERARPVFEVLGTPHLLGPTGAGQIAKLVNQTIVAVTIGAVAEGLFLAEKSGLDSTAVLAALQGGFADSRILREHGGRMIRRDFTPGAANRIFLKDLSAIGSLAHDTGVGLPLTERTAQAFTHLVAWGLSEHDHSSYFTYLARFNDPASPHPAVR